jgi:integrase/recombinase XerD
MTQGDPINTVWKAHFHEYNQAEEYREVTTHYGRHYFTRYWKIQEEIQRELVQYMRGDELGDTRSGDSIDDYLAAYYEDIKTIYLDRVPKFL